MKFIIGPKSEEEFLNFLFSGLGSKGLSIVKACGFDKDLLVKSEELCSIL